jgi:hypothetical protein
MAATRKSTKRTAGKKRSSAKRSSTKKRTSRKSASRGRAKSKALKTTTLKRRARKGLKAAKGGIESMRQVGERTWETLKSTTAQVVEGVRDRI